MTRAKWSRYAEVLDWHAGKHENRPFDLRLRDHDLLDSYSCGSNSVNSPKECTQINLFTPTTKEERESIIILPIDPHFIPAVVSTSDIFAYNRSIPGGLSPNDDIGMSWKLLWFWSPTEG